MSDRLREALEEIRDDLRHQRTVCAEGGLDKLEVILITMRSTLEWIASQKNLFFAECSQAEEIITRCKAALAASEPAPVFDLQLFYDQLVDGQIIKESDGEPWPLTKSEALQIVTALSERLKIVWPLRQRQP